MCTQRRIRERLHRLYNQCTRRNFGIQLRVTAEAINFLVTETTRVTTNLAYQVYAINILSTLFLNSFGGGVPQALREAERRAIIGMLLRNLRMFPARLVIDLHLIEEELQRIIEVEIQRNMLVVPPDNEYKAEIKAATNPAINESKLESVGFPLELVPEQFKSELAATVMDNPVTIPTSTNKEYKWDQFDLDQWNRQSRATRNGRTENPYDVRQRLDVIEPDLLLKFQIDSFVTLVTKAINAKKHRGEVLTKEDYEKIGSLAFLEVKHYTLAPVIISSHRTILRP